MIRRSAQWTVAALCLAAAASTPGGTPSPALRLRDLGICDTCDVQTNEAGARQFVCVSGDLSPCFTTTGTCSVRLIVTVTDAPGADPSKICPNGTGCPCSADDDCSDVGGTCQPGADGNLRCQSALCRSAADCASGGGVCGADANGDDRCQHECPPSNATVAVRLEGGKVDGTPFSLDIPSVGNCEGALRAFSCPPDGPDASDGSTFLCSGNFGRLTESALFAVKPDDLKFQPLIVATSDLQQACGVLSGFPIIMSAIELAADPHVEDPRPSVRTWCVKVYFKE